MTDWSFDAWPAIEPKWHPGSHRADPWDTMEFHVDLGCGTVKKGRIGIDRYPAPGVNVVMDLDDGRVFAVSPEPGRAAAEWLENGWRYRTPGRKYSGEPGDQTLDYLDYPDIPTGWTGTGWDYASGRSQPYTIRCGLPFEDSSIESIITHHALEHIGEGFLPLMDDIYRVLKPGGILRAIVPLFPSYAAVSDPDHCRYFMEGTFDSLCGTPDNCWLSSFSVPYAKARFEKLDEDMTARVEPEKHWTREDAREMRVALKACK